jgi:hypothetical protein
MKTKVVFRFWRGEVIALFPEVPSDVNGYYCESYQHVGQHSGADYNGIIRESRPATPAEYADLHAELTRIGYDLEVVQRASRLAFKRRREELALAWD